MKTTIQISMILLGLVAIGSSAAIFGSETAISAYSIAGLLWIGLTDSARRPADSHARSVNAGSRPAVEVACAVHQACPAA